MAASRLRLSGSAAAAGAAVVAAALLATAGPTPAQSGNYFATSCSFSHRAPDDPIVAPDRPGASHSHDFFGNLTTGASSTFESLGVSETTCRREADRAAYWVPTLYMAGQPVRPDRAQVYYQAGAKNPATVVAPPPGLRVIAGQASAGGPQPASVVSWGCKPGSGIGQPGEAPTCPAGSHLTVRIRFGDCWDGQNLDSANHQSHLTVPVRRACPASHPVPIPQISLNIHYPQGVGGPAVALSSGAAHTAHADFFNAWDQSELERLVASCINVPRTAEICNAGSRAPVQPPSIAPAAGPLTFGGELVLRGVSGRLAASPVRIQVERARRWQPLAEVQTTVGGRFEHRLRATRNARYRVVDRQGVISAPMTVVVRPAVTLAAPRVARAGRRMKVGVRVSPAKRAVLLRAERLGRGGWLLAKRAKLRPRAGRAAAALAPSRPGRWRLRALTRGDPLHAAGRGALEVRVRG